jgi:hypothetical protein
MKHLKMLGVAALAAMGLMAFAGSASATTLSVEGVKKNEAVTIKATLAAGSSALLKDKNGTTADTCTGSTVEGTTTAFDPPSGPVSKLEFTGCSHTTHVLKPGSLSVAWISNTEGTVTSSGAEVTVVSTVFGASAICKTGTGTVVGTLTGVASGHATMDIDATNSLNCGILGTSSWTGTYTVTSPTGLGVES